MNATELQSYITANGLLGSCRVWTTGMEKWMQIFELPDLIEFMGITRRKSPRAPIKGEVVIQTPDKQIVTQLGTISEGGIGTTKTEGLTKGTNCDLVVKSPMLISPIHTKAQVVYANPKGNSGFQFQNLQAESQSIIVSFVKQFKS